MNAAVADPGRWTARRWVYTVAAAFALQAGLLLFLGQREQPRPSRSTFPTAVHLVSDPWSAEQLARLPSMSDPTLFALPTESGFSGAGAKPPTTLEFQAERWSEPPRWLALDAASLGNDFARFTATNAITPPIVADKPLPPLSRYEPNIPSEPLARQSRLRIEGDLASRPLRQPLELVSWPHTDILSNTVVRVAVDADGRTISAVLMADSGRKDADLLALQLAAAARFQPLPRAARAPRGQTPLAWGKLIFQWHTLPLNGTNPAFPQP